MNRSASSPRSIIAFNSSCGGCLRIDSAKVLVAGVAIELLASAGQHLERVEVVDRLEPVGGDTGELQHPPARCFGTRGISRNAVPCR